LRGKLESPKPPGAVWRFVRSIRGKGRTPSYPRSSGSATS